MRKLCKENNHQFVKSKDINNKTCLVCINCSVIREEGYYR